MQTLNALSSTYLFFFLPLSLMSNFFPSYFLTTKFTFSVNLMFPLSAALYYNQLQNLYCYLTLWTCIHAHEEQRVAHSVVLGTFYYAVSSDSYPGYLGFRQHLTSLHKTDCLTYYVATYSLTHSQSHPKVCHSNRIQRTTTSGKKRSSLPWQRCQASQC